MSAIDAESSNRRRNAMHCQYIFYENENDSDLSLLLSSFQFPVSVGFVIVLGFFFSRSNPDSEIGFLIIALCLFFCIDWNDAFVTFPLRGRIDSISSEMMEMNKKSSHSREKPTMGRSSSSSEVKKPVEKDLSSSTFVNQAAICWQESRKKWVNKNSQQQQRMERESIISWSTAYEDLLSTNEPFSEPIPLPEMVDFLVDIWQDEGLFD